MQTPIELIVGLGNPGPQYAQTRHNAGADFVAQLASQNAVPLSDTPKFSGRTGRLNLHGRDLRLLIPTTYMNLSGQAVAAIAGFYRIAPEAILVAHDELDLPPGTARLKRGGGHGGHNGLRNIISALGNNRDFARLRLGIGHPGNAGQVVSYVLQKAPSVERELSGQACDNALTVIELLTAGEWNRAVHELHSA